MVVCKILSTHTSTQVKLSKSKQKKTWTLLFPPTCFGDRFKVARCIIKRIKEETPKGKIPECPIHDECISESIRREVVEIDRESKTHKV